MKVRELAQKLNLRLFAGEDGLEREISGVYIGDLLSRVMSNSESGSAWITIHTHVNIVAVASLNELSCIIIPEGIEPEENTLDKAVAESIPILGKKVSSYSLACRIYELGIK